MWRPVWSTSVFLFDAQLTLQCLPQLPLSDQLQLQLCPLQLVLLLLRPGVFYGNPQQTLLGDTSTGYTKHPAATSANTLTNTFT